MGEEKTAYDYWKEANDRLQTVINQNEDICDKVDRILILVDGDPGLGVIGLRKRVETLERKQEGLERKNPFWLLPAVMALMVIDAVRLQN